MGQFTCTCALYFEINGKMVFALWIVALQTVFVEQMFPIKQRMGV